MGTHEDLLARHRQVLPSWMVLYYQEPIALVDGDGRRVTDAEGNEYLDFFGGILTTMTGYNVPEVVAAIKAQADQMLHTSTLYLIENQIELAEKIAELSGIPDAKVFFTNSGTEANDAALMLATQYRKSNQVLAMRGSYHGKSHSTVAITGQRNWSSTSLYPFNVTYRARRVQAAQSLRPPSRCRIHRCLQSRPREPAGSRHRRRRCLHDRRADSGCRRLRHSPRRLLRRLQGGSRSHRDSLHFRRGPDRVGPDRRTLLGLPVTWHHPRHPHLRQGPRKRHGPGRGGGNRVADGFAARQLDFHVRRQPDVDRRRTGQPRLSARARPPDQRLQGR